jgi:UDP-N-acetylmuramoyl-tripeptide--D-alanyl-D-alanine ligase
MLYNYFYSALPDVAPSDKFFLPFVSFWARILLKVKNPLIIGITGTAGKTTATQLISHVLKQPNVYDLIGPVGATKGNQNGDYGVRLSILQCPFFPSNRIRRIFLVFYLPFLTISKLFSRSYPKVLVLEYGTYAAGHIRDLVKFAPPKIAVVTNIGPAHLERHMTVEGVFNEKRALVQCVPSDGLVVLGSGHDFVGRLQADSKAVVSIVDGRGIDLAREITISICKFLQIPAQFIGSGFDTFIAPAKRLNIFVVGEVTVIDDSYNANLLSMKYGVDYLQQIASGRRVAIFGFMAELGTASQAYHNEVGNYAREHTDLLISLGKEAEHYNSQMHFPQYNSSMDEIAGLLLPGDTVLIKGSGAANLGSFVKAIKQHLARS